jgi:surface antigen
MVATKRRAGAVVGSLALAVALAVPAMASAAGIPAAPANADNTTPDCPVSASVLVCGWNVPVDSGNLFSALDYGECPYWAAEKYPALVLDELLADPLGRDWDGNTWLEHAQLEGLATSSTPASGDLAVWGSVPSNPAGHVAYVEAVDGGAIIVSQMDGASTAPFPAMQGSTEYISASNLVYYAANDDLEFIVTGDGSDTPLSDVELAPTPAPTTTSASTSSDRTSASGQTAKSTAAGKRKTAAGRRTAAEQRRRAAAAKQRRRAAVAGQRRRAAAAARKRRAAAAKHTTG